jgi:hypothetical protein
LTLLAGLAILVGGAALALTGDAIAERSGLGTSIVGFALVGFCTSLPELSSVIAALKLHRYQLAIGDIFGTNLFNIQIIFIADLFYRGDAVLSSAGTFEVVAACLSVVMTGIFVVGMLERRDRTIWRMGTDSALALMGNQRPLTREAPSAPLPCGARGPCRKGTGKLRRGGRASLSPAIRRPLRHIRASAAPRVLFRGCR